jgi:hypothetical protein
LVGGGLNKHKGPSIAGIDPISGQPVPLFHPRQQGWERHFAWDGLILLGRTRSARATIRLLAINPRFSSLFIGMWSDFMTPIACHG